MDALDQRLREIVRRLARMNPLTPVAITASEDVRGLSHWSHKHILKALLKGAKDFRARDQLGKLRAALLMGTTVLGDMFLTPIERSGILLANGRSDIKFAQLLNQLIAETTGVSSPDWTLLNDRLRSYSTYQRLVATISSRNIEVLRSLRIRPRRIVKVALGFTALAFLHKYLDLEIPSEFSDLINELDGPEEISNVASLIVVLASEYHPLDAFDFAFPIGDLEIGDLRSLMAYSRMLVQQYEVGKLLSLFRYRLESLCDRKLVFSLYPPFPAFEYSLRLGFIRSEMDRAKALIDVCAVKGGPTTPLITSAEHFVDEFRNDLSELKHAGTPRRVLRLKFPVIPHLYENLKDAVFSDDLLSRERLLQDSLIHWLYTDQQKLQITEHLDIETFYAAWRYLKFASLVDILLLRPYNKTDLTLLLNSLVRSLDEESGFELLNAFGISKEQASDFLDLISADANHLRYLDLQYRPFLRIAETPVPWTGEATKPQFLFLPALVSNSNVLRNVQSANQFRIKSNARLFVDLVGATLRSRFEKVLTNKRVEGEKATDIDVILLDGDTLYLFECKHSLPPAGPHELRDIWEEIEYATQQLENATTILANVARRHDYLAGWFPGSRARDTSNLKIASCVLCSHRIFAEMAHRGFPIRDFASLKQLCEGGIVGMAEVEADGEAVMHRYRITHQVGFSGEDLHDYLSPDPNYFKTFAPFMQVISHFYRFQDIVLVRETYWSAVSLEEWDDQMGALGFPREKDMKVSLPFAFPGEDSVIGRY